MPFMSKIEYLRTAANFCHPIEKGNYCVTTTLENDRNREDSKPYVSIDAEKEIGPVLNIEICSNY